MSQIPPEVLSILRASTITDCRLVLPVGDLSRDLYTAVNKVIAAAGGKWDRKAKAHVFPRDPRPQLGLALATGKVVSTKKDTQAFYTPAAVVAKTLGYLPALKGMVVLEPSAGEGAFADAIRAEGADVVCCEIDPESASVLIRKGHTVITGDFLGCKVSPAGYDAIVMNPPFAKDQDMQHVLHAFRFLKPGGVLLAITGTGWENASSKRRQDFQAFVAEHGAVVERFPAGSFKESGTQVSTLLIRLTA
ncbi:class I SAM-dependent methyltransferase [Hymenobacter koreensis]|uniref:Methyltransferase n=1 Tax=Hymenobacter koreensis TaxID=1084523 RepID=A0ABP8JMX0_9BACT